MRSFISQVLQELSSRDTPISEYTFILPSKRAGAFLLHQFASNNEQPTFAPVVMSIEDFAQDIAGLKSVDNVTALFEFYSAYRNCVSLEKTEDFERFSSWAHTLLHDFNEIDRYLVDHRSFFGYLANIQEVNHWSLQEEKTPLMENYLSFWNKLPVFYEQLQEQLEGKSMAYQGMVYRKASEKIDAYIQKHQSPHIFLGFNALNAAEQIIFQRMMDSGIGEVFWDVDQHFFDDEHHDVSHFMRHYANSWPIYKDRPFGPISKDYSSEKNIEIVGIPKNIGQAKYLGEILASMPPEELHSTAVVLGDESLLLPVLNSLPPQIDQVNVTMGFGLNNAPIVFLFDRLLQMHAVGKEKWYHKDITAITSHPLVQRITQGGSNSLTGKIRKENLVYLTEDQILEGCLGKTRKLYEICFTDWMDRPEEAVDHLQNLIFFLKQNLDQHKDKVLLEFLYHIHILFNKLNNLIREYGHISNIKTLYSIYKDLLASQKVDFRGKPFSGLQLMGVLESRVLDFKNVILLSVNEGILPAGKSNNSFVPFDLKCAYDLPTYKEKDAIYAYHFYHLLQRAQQVHLFYNTESNGLNGGEKSRFLLQLEMEGKEQHRIKRYTVVPKVPPVNKFQKEIKKSPEIMTRLRGLAEKGFSPSALTTYVRNPLDFYKQYVLNIRDEEEIEETIAYNTLGTVVHDTLERFYKQWENKELRIEDLEESIERTSDEIRDQFLRHYTSEPVAGGKNLLIFEVAKRYVSNFLKKEIKSLQAGNKIKVLQIENKLTCSFPIEGLEYPVNIRGTVDRVDEFNGMIRIIDYKTGRVEQNKVEIVEWSDISSDYDKYSKSFQVLMYTILLNEQTSLKFPVEAGIISFKNLKGGFLKFSKKDKQGNGANKDTHITGETLAAFKEQLRNLIEEICNPDIPFTEKEIKQKTW